MDHNLRPTIVCLGASAGGLEALYEFFETYESQPKFKDISVVVVVHLSPDFESLLPELIARKTSMSVLKAKDGMSVQPNHVYIIPPSTDMLLEKSGLKLEAQDRRAGHAPNLPIDLFLVSMAKTCGDRCIGVILSGTGSDGSRGIRAVKESGGMVFAQTPITAKFDGMPTSAYQTGAVDALGSPQDIALRLGRYLEHQNVIDDVDISITESQFIKFFELLAKCNGQDFSHMRESIVRRRISRRMALLGEKNFEAYIKILIRDSTERNHLSHDLLIGVTNFYRDSSEFDALMQSTVPKILKHLDPTDQFRVWVAGCSTGQEAYTLAMLIYDVMESLSIPRDLRIFATDVNETALGIASRGVYSLSDVADLPQSWVAKYMHQQGLDFVVSPILRKSIIFAKHHLVNDPPFTRMSLVTCRNVLIYLKPEIQQRVLGSIFLSLTPEHGYAMLGSAESVGPFEYSLTSTSEGSKIYMRQGKKPSHLISRPLLKEPVSIIRTHPIVPRISSALLHDESKRDRSLRAALEALAEIETRSVAIVEAPHRLQEVITDPDKLFSFPKGVPTDDLGQILPSPVTSGLAVGAKQLSEGESEVYLQIPTREGIEYQLMLRVLTNSPEEPMLFLLVIRSGINQHEHPEPTVLKVDIELRTKELERELRDTKEHLKSTIEKLLTSNEEQQSTNEELVTSNEELQSTNEELHSVNEELFTVNTEYRLRNNELATVTADLDNLLKSMDIATLYLDKQQKIRRFTPSMAKLLPLQDADIDRPITDFSHNLDVNLAEISKAAEQSAAILEREVRDHHGHWLLLRCIPYRSSENEIQGSLLTFVNITRIKNAEESARLMSHQLKESNTSLVGQTEQLEAYFSVVAQDMRAPVTGLSQTLKSALTNLNQQDINLGIKHVKEAFSSLQSLESLLKCLTMLSTQAVCDFTVEEVQVAPWLENLLSPYFARAEAEGVILKYAVSGSTVHFSRTAAAGIIANLVENAFVHGTSHPQPRIDILAQIAGDCVRFTIADNGSGIPENQPKKVFELFRHLESADPKTSGVGLVAAYRLAEKAGGQIQLYNNEGQGTQFVVELPNCRPDVTKPAEDARAPILLVEDDVLEARHVQNVLKDYNVNVAQTMDEGLELLQKKTYALVILDLSLPDGHGLNLMTAYRSWKTPNTPIMILSGHFEGVSDGIKKNPLVYSSVIKTETNGQLIREEVDRKLKTPLQLGHD